MPNRERLVISQSQSETLDFPAQYILVENLTGSWLYIRVGALDIPNSNSADKLVPPFCIFAFPVPPTNLFGVAIGAQAVVIPTQIPTAPAAITFFDQFQQMTLASLPLQQSGYRYREVLRDNVLIATGTTVHIQRDLSNFSNARYSLKLIGAANSLVGTLWAMTMEGTSQAGTLVPFAPAATISVVVGGPKLLNVPNLNVKVDIQVDNVAVSDLHFTDILEAWN